MARLLRMKRCQLLGARNDQEWERQGLQEHFPLSAITPQPCNRLIYSGKHWENLKVSILCLAPLPHARPDSDVAADCATPAHPSDQTTDQTIVLQLVVALGPALFFFTLSLLLLHLANL